MQVNPIPFLSLTIPSFKDNPIVFDNDTQMNFGDNSSIFPNTDFHAEEVAQDFHSELEN